MFVFGFLLDFANFMAKRGRKLCILTFLALSIWLVSMWEHIFHMVSEHRGAQTIIVGFYTYGGESIEMSVKHLKKIVCFMGEHTNLGVYSLYGGLLTHC